MNFRLPTSVRTLTETLLLVMLLNATAYAQDQRPQEELRDTIIAAYMASISKFSHVSYCLDYNTRYTHDGHTLRFSPVRYHISSDGISHSRDWIYIDGDRFDMISLRDGDLSPPLTSNLITRCVARSTIYRPDRIVEYISDLYENSFDPSFSFHSIDEPVKDYISQTLGLTGCGSGYLTGHPYALEAPTLQQFIETAKISIRKSELDLANCVVVVAESSLYTISITLDPSLEFQPRRIIQRRKDPSNLGVDADITEMKYLGNGRDSICCSAVARILVHLAKDNFTQICTEIKVENVDFQPDFMRSGAFKLVSPPKPFINNSDQPGIPYVLKNGDFEIVSGDHFESDVDHFIQQTKDIRSSKPNIRGYGLVTVYTLVSATVVILIGFLFYRRSTKGRWL